MVRCASFLALLLPLAVNAAVPVSGDCVGVNAIRPGCGSKEAQYRRDVFYVGGRYIPNSFGGNIFVDQVYVEKLVPSAGINKPHPLVFLHGGGISGVVRSPIPKDDFFVMHPS